MSVPYDTFIGAFLSKITDFDFADMNDDTRTTMTDMFLKRAVTAFRKNCAYDLVGTANDADREFDVDIAPDDLDEIVEIVSEGMVVQWLKPFLYQQENLQNALSTRDYSVYSPAELLARITNAYNQTQRNYVQMIREYSYNHGDLRGLHL